MDSICEATTSPIFRETAERVIPPTLRDYTGRIPLGESALSSLLSGKNPPLRGTTESYIYGCFLPQKDLESVCTPECILAGKKEPKIFPPTCTAPVHVYHKGKFSSLQPERFEDGNDGKYAYLFILSPEEVLLPPRRNPLDPMEKNINREALRKIKIKARKYFKYKGPSIIGVFLPVDTGELMYDFLCEWNVLQRRGKIVVEEEDTNLSFMGLWIAGVIISFIIFLVIGGIVYGKQKN